MIGTFSAEGLLMCWTCVLIKRPHKILSWLSGEAVKESQTVVVTFGSAVCLNPPPDSCFTVVIQVCSLLSPSFNPSPLTPTLHCSHSNTPASHRKLFLRTFYCHSWVAVDEASLARLCFFFVLFVFCHYWQQRWLQNPLTVPMSSGQGGVVGSSTPPPNCWNSKKQHTSKPMLMWAEFRTKTTSWMWPDLFIDTLYLSALLVYNGQQFQVQEGVQWSWERSLHGPFS